MIVTEDRKYLKDISYNSAEEFLKAISYGGELEFLQKENFIFRGHESDKYKLLPTALRDYLFLESFDANDIDEKIFFVGTTEYFQIVAESMVYKRFFDLCDNRGLNMPEVTRLRDTMIFPIDLKVVLQKEDWLPQELEGIVALAQHHGLPTRLLDWTSNLYTALYFASSGAVKRQVEPERMTKAEWVKKQKESMLSMVDEFQNRPLLDKCVEKMEIWAFNVGRYLSLMGKTDLHLIHPRYSDNPNLCAQEGLFSYWRIEKPMMKDIVNVPEEYILIVDQESFDSKLVQTLDKIGAKPEDYLYRITVPYSGASDIYLFAQRNEKDASTLFPGYDGIVRRMKEDKLCARLIKKIDNKEKSDVITRNPLVDVLKSRLD